MKLNCCLAALASAFLLLNASGSEFVKHPKNQDSPLLRGPYVQLATSDSIFVVWRTETKSIPIVRFGNTPDNLDRVVGDEAILRALGTTNKDLKFPKGTRRLHSAPKNCWQYEAQLQGLQPDTVYYYAVFDGKKRLTEPSPNYRFRTHPIPGTDRPVRFWVVGDSGVGRESQSFVQVAMKDYVGRQNHPLDFYIHLGDMAYYSGKDVEFQTRFFEMYQETLQNTVCWATMGNHEGGTSKGTNGLGPYYDGYVLPTRGEAGGLPSGTEAFYSFDYGRVHFICLDSHDLDRKPTGAMARWLQADLDQTKQDWIIAYFHHPPYTKGSHDSDREKQLVQMRLYIMPILESGGVDLVLTGHSHIYERSMLIDGAYQTPTIAEGVVLDDREGNPDTDGPYQKSAGIHPNEGAVQIVAGNGGINVRRRGTMPVMRKIIVEHGSVIVDVKGDTLDAVMVNKYGEVRDHFGITKRSVVTPRRMTNPWQPPLWQPPKGPDGKEPPPQPPDDYMPVVPEHSDWHYLVGSKPDANWNRLDYDDSFWRIGAAGFGYTYKEARTVLREMKGNYQAVYIRHEFQIDHAEYLSDMGLMISYDDAFIAYLNGKEVARSGVGKGQGVDAKEIKSHDANGRYSYFPLKEFEKHLKDGRNVIAIEGHNSSLESSDFLLDPWLLIED
ncbi:MAG TPA: metallophosphoesterase family protein [Candidatus Saccharimonadales bacterium]|nr:metallophosphoesterase family protein [Candidatus Saccharimonadales bacterium]